MPYNSFNLSQLANDYSVFYNEKSGIMDEPTNCEKLVLSVILLNCI